MKRTGNLFDKICTIENMRLAYKRATQGKKHYREVRELEKDVEGNLQKLLEELKTHKYRTSKYHIFHMRTGGKVREIYKLPMRDRIVQHALMNYMEPVMRKTFVYDTYQSIKGRGIHMGLSRVQKALKDKKNTVYCLKLDIHKYYPSIDQTLMKQRLSKVFKDKDLLEVLYEIVDSTDKGVPIGNYTSQYFANLFLTPMDHWIKEQLKVKYYFRYCDDIVILSSSKDELRGLLEQINQYVKSLKLELKPNWQIFPVENRGINFIGYVIRHNYTLIRKTTKNNFISKITKKLSFKDRRSVLGSYWGIFCHADCTNLWQTYTKVKSIKQMTLQIKERIPISLLIDIPITIISINTSSKHSKPYIQIYATLYDHTIKIISQSINMLYDCIYLNDILPFNTSVTHYKNHFKFKI